MQKREPERRTFREVVNGTLDFDELVIFTQVGWITGAGHFVAVDHPAAASTLAKYPNQFSPVWVEGPNE